MAKWLSLPPLTKEVPLAAALYSAPWPQQGATSEPEPFSQAAAGTISLRPAPLAPDEDNSPVEGSNAAASGFEQADTARGTCGQLEPVVPGAHACQLLPPMAGAGSSGVSAPIEEPPAVQWARARTQESAWLGTQPREHWQGAGGQQDAPAPARATWGSLLHSRRPAQGLGRPNVDSGPGLSAPSADAWSQTSQAADGGRQWGAEAGGAPAVAAVPGRHSSGGAGGVAAMLAAIAAAKERQADDARMLDYFASDGATAAGAGHQPEGEPTSGRASSLAPAATARPQTGPPAAVITPSGAAFHNRGAGSEAAAMLAAVAAAKERQADESHMLGYFAAHGGSGAAAAEQAGAATTRSARQGLGEVPAGSLARAASVHDSALEGVGGHEVLLQALRQNPEAELRLFAALGRKVGSHSEVVRSGPAPKMQLQ